MFGSTQKSLTLTDRFVSIKIPTSPSVTSPRNEKWRHSNNFSDCADDVVEVSKLY